MQTGRAVISLSNTTAVNGDRIEGREGFAEFVTGEWVGDLTHLTPNRGYRVVSNNAGVLNYYGIAGNPDARQGVTHTMAVDEPLFGIKEQATDTGWKIDEHAYPETMYMTGIIAGNKLDSDEAHVIGAFVGDECRGVAVPQKIDGEYRYFMVVYGRPTDEVVEFRIIDNQTGQQHTVASTTTFVSGKNHGSYARPYTWDIDAEESVSELSSAMKVYPNPMRETTTIVYEISETSPVIVTITDLNGREVKRLAEGVQQAGNIN